MKTLFRIMGVVDSTVHAKHEQLTSKPRKKPKSKPVKPPKVTSPKEGNSVEPSPVTEDSIVEPLPEDIV